MSEEKKNKTEGNTGKKKKTVLLEFLKYLLYLQDCVCSQTCLLSTRAKDSV